MPLALAADHHRGLHAQRLDLADVTGDARSDRRVDPKRLVAHQGFTGELEQDATVNGRGH